MIGQLSNSAATPNVSIRNLAPLTASAQPLADQKDGYVGGGASQLPEYWSPNLNKGQCKDMQSGHSGPSARPEPGDPAAIAQLGDGNDQARRRLREV